MRLYQYEICPFCCKVKAYMDWQKLPYHTIEVNPLSKAEIKFSEGYRKVPIASINGEQVNGSLEIIKALLQDQAADIEDPEVAEWLAWTDNKLAVLLFPNITRSLGESYQAFRYISEVPTFSGTSKAANQFAGSLAMWLANGRLKKKYGITDERKQLLDVVGAWTAAVGEGPFLKGPSVSLADVAVYGVLSSIRGLATYEELMSAAPALKQWSDRVREAIGASARVEETPPASPRTIGPTAP